MKALFIDTAVCTVAVFIRQASGRSVAAPAGEKIDDNLYLSLSIREEK